MTNFSDSDSVFIFVLSIVCHEVKKSSSVVCVASSARLAWSWASYVTNSRSCSVDDDKPEHFDLLPEGLRGTFSNIFSIKESKKFGMACRVLGK